MLACAWWQQFVASDAPALPGASQVDVAAYLVVEHGCDLVKRDNAAAGCRDFLALVVVLPTDQPSAVAGHASIP